jgi:hypothetical protein
MLSLFNTYTKDELHSFFARANRALAATQGTRLVTKREDS